MGDEEEKKSQESQGQEDQQQSPLSNASNIKGPAEKIVKEAAKTARGLTGAGATSEAAATTEAAAGTVAGTAGAGGATGAAAAGATEGAVATTAVGGSALGAASSSLGAYAAITVIILVLILTILLALFGNEQTVIAGTPTTPPVVEPPPIYGCSDDLDGILQSHNITVVNVQTCERKAVIVNAIIKLLSYPDFASKYGSGSLTIKNETDAQGDWVGLTHNGSSVSVKDMDGTKYNDSYWNYIITHEMFHVLSSRTNRELTASYDYTTYYDDEPDCYNNSRGGVFKTYQLPTTDKAESMAESGAVYVTGRGGTESFPDFETTCKDNYEFWYQEIGEPPTVDPGNGNTGGNRTGPLVSFMAGNHPVQTNYASSNTCNGKYDLANTTKFPIGNFGDPNCDVSQDAVKSYVLSNDPLINTPFCSNSTPVKCYNRIDVWMGIITCESHFNPNDLGRGKSGWGAWGMFQMNPDFAKGKGPHDNGTTDWRNQIINAITRNDNQNGGRFGYWGCSRGYRHGTK